MHDIEHDVQYMTWQQLGIEVGVEAFEKAIQSVCKEEKIIDRIAIQKPLVTKHNQEKKLKGQRANLKLIDIGQIRKMFSFQIKFILDGVMKEDYISNVELVLHMHQNTFTILESHETKIESGFTVGHLLAGISSRLSISMILEIKMER